jgi:hypothetical protein
MLKPVFDEPDETMGDQFAGGTRPTERILTAEEIQAQRKQERIESARKARLDPRWGALLEILE